MEPLWKEMPVSRTFSNYPSRSPARKPSIQVPFTELPQRERDTPPPEPLSTIFSHNSIPIWSLPVITLCTYRTGRRTGPQEVEITAITCSIRTLCRKLYCAPPLLVWVTVQCNHRSSALGARTCGTEIWDKIMGQTDLLLLLYTENILQWKKQVPLKQHYVPTETALCAYWNSTMCLLKHVAS